jgi:hypothetical protein
MQTMKTIFAWLLSAVCTVIILCYLSFVLPAIWANWNYAPHEGDIVFQSLPKNKLVDAIEGVTESRVSHCGIVGREDGKWVVYEAFRGGVQTTPLYSYLLRGRDYGYAVYRLKPEYQAYIPETLRCARTYMGKPYDIRYRMDDDKIYCSELIYKAYRTASNGDALGTLVQFGALNWQPYENVITYFEGGPVPLDREMITPVDLANAPQLENVYSFRFE